MAKEVAFLNVASFLIYVLYMWQVCVGYMCSVCVCAYVAAGRAMVVLYWSAPYSFETVSLTAWGTRLVAGKRALGDSSVSAAGLWLQEQAAIHSFRCEQCGFGLSSSCLYGEHSYPLSHPPARKLLSLITLIDYYFFSSWSLKQLRRASNSLCNYR